MKKFKELGTIEISQFTEEDIKKHVDAGEDRDFIKQEIQNCINIVSKMGL